MDSDEEAAGSLSTIVPLAKTRKPSHEKRASRSHSHSRSSSRSRSLSRSNTEDRPRFDHRPSIASLYTDEEEEDPISSARGAQPVVETETVESVPLLGVSQPGSLRIKKSSDQVGGSGSSLASNSRGPSKARRKRLAAASRADIFAAKVASKMDEAASSDSDETFVYDTNRDALRRPYALRTSSTLSLPVSPMVKSQRGQGAGLHVQTLQGHSNSASGTVHPSPSRLGANSTPEEERGRRRLPFLKETPRRLSQKNDSTRAKHVYLSRWRGGELDDDDESDDAALPIDEYTPLAQRTAQRRAPQQTPHDYASSRQLAPLYIRVTLWFVAFAMCGMFCTFVVGVLVASSRPLVGVEIARLVDVFPSDKELVLSIIVQAKNPGCFTVTSSRVDLDLFATTNYASELYGSNQESEGSTLTRTVMLGNVQALEAPLEFPGSFFNPRHTFSMSNIRLVTPCANATELWQDISTHTFELTVRGVVKYSLLFSQDLRTSVSSSIVVRPDQIELDGS